MRLSVLVAALGLAIQASPAFSASINTPEMPRSFQGGAHTTDDKWLPSWMLTGGTAPARLASKASWYGPGFYGRRTANGEIFTGRDMTAAHKTLPFGTKVRVTNLRNSRSVVVRINDDGPHVPGRVIDLSEAAAAKIGLISSGVAPVRLEVLK